jgi:hypothetical protein
MQVKDCYMMTLFQTGYLKVIKDKRLLPFRDPNIILKNLKKNCLLACASLQIPALTEQSKPTLIA